jgi:hypothetical protein
MYICIHILTYSKGHNIPSKEYYSDAFSTSRYHTGTLIQKSLFLLTRATLDL